MRATTLHAIGSAALVLVVAGCANRPVSTLVMLPTGYQIVAEGRPPVGFLNSSGGHLIVQDVTTNSTVYSMTFPSGDNYSSSAIKVQGNRLVAQEPGDASGSADLVLLDGINERHWYRLLFRPASPTTQPTSEH